MLQSTCSSALTAQKAWLICLFLFYSSSMQVWWELSKFWLGSKPVNCCYCSYVCMLENYGSAINLAPTNIVVGGSPPLITSEGLWQLLCTILFIQPWRKFLRRNLFKGKISGRREIFGSITKGQPIRVVHCQIVLQTDRIQGVFLEPRHWKGIWTFGLIPVREFLDWICLPVKGEEKGDVKGGSQNGLTWE